MLNKSDKNPVFIRYFKSYITTYLTLHFTEEKNIKECEAFQDTEIP